MNCCCVCAVWTAAVSLVFSAAAGVYMCGVVGEGHGGLDITGQNASLAGQGREQDCEWFHCCAVLAAAGSLVVSAIGSSKCWPFWALLWPFVSQAHVTTTCLLPDHPIPLAEVVKGVTALGLLPLASSRMFHTNIAVALLLSFLSTLVGMPGFLQCSCPPGPHHSSAHLTPPLASCSPRTPSPPATTLLVLRR